MARQLGPLLGVLGPSAERQFSARFHDVLLLTALLLLLGVVAVAWMRLRQRRASTPSVAPLSRLEARRASRFWCLGLMLTLTAAAGLNLVVDPYGLYGSGVLAPVSMQMRRLKAEAYEALPGVPQVVVMGSSVAHSISPGTIRQQLGMTAFNAAVGSGRIDDFVIQAKLMSAARGGRIPGVFLVQLDPRLLHGGEETASLTPLSMLRFLRPSTAWLAVRQRFVQAIGWKQTGDSLYVLRAAGSAAAEATPRELNPDGELVEMIAARDARPMGPTRFDRRMDRFIRRASAAGRTVGCRELDPLAVRDLEEFLRLTVGRGSAVVFYFSPPHPRYRREVLEPAVAYQACRELVTDHLRRLAAMDEAIEFLDFTLLESIGGDDSAAGYTDPFHLTPVNGDRLVAAAAPALLEASAAGSGSDPQAGDG